MEEKLTENASVTAFFTGHRLIPADRKSRLPARVFQCISNAYSEGFRRFFCGCALGFDTIAAFQVLRFRDIYPDVILSLAVPCATQSERWPEPDRILYRQLLDKADDLTVLSPYYYKGVMLTRNRYMADRSSLCICYLTQMQSGTASAVRYASVHKGMKIINLAVRDQENENLMRENTWNCMYISPSVRKSAITAPLCLSPAKMKLTMKNM